MTRPRLTPWAVFLCQYSLDSKIVLLMCRSFPNIIQKSVSMNNLGNNREAFVLFKRYSFAISNESILDITIQQHKLFLKLG